MSRYSESYYSVAARKPNWFRRTARRLNLTPVAAALRERVHHAAPGARVLDVGCGTGQLLEVFRQMNPALEGIGVDLGTPPRDGAASLFLRGRAERLPFGAGSADIVTCAHVLEHSHDPYAIVTELARVCAPGGVIYLETPSGRAASLPFPTFWDDATHVRPYSPRALGQMLEAQGLAVVKMGHKYSLAAALLGLPYMIVGSLLGDARARWLWPTYTFGLNAYALGVKPGSRPA